MAANRFPDVVDVYGCMLGRELLTNKEWLIWAIHQADLQALDIEGVIHGLRTVPDVGAEYDRIRAKLARAINDLIKRGGLHEQSDRKTQPAEPAATQPPDHEGG